MAALWHELEIGEDKGFRFGVLKTDPECGCEPKEPCATMQAYYDHNILPGGVPIGQYRIRLGTFRILQVETVSRETED